MERMPARKPRQYFETLARPSHVTFDDGTQIRRSLSWIHFIEANWEYFEPDVIRVLIGEWLVVLTGHNLASLFTALEDQALARVRAQPELARDPEHDIDSFVTEIRFFKAPNATKQKGQTELELGLS
jgi:hypothetical protein